MGPPSMGSPSSPEDSFGSAATPSTPSKGQKKPRAKRTQTAASIASSDRSTKRTRLDEAEVQVTNTRRRAVESCNNVVEWYQALQSAEITEDARKALGIAFIWLGTLKRDGRVLKTEIEKGKSKKMPKIDASPCAMAQDDIDLFWKALEEFDSAIAPTPSEFADVKCWGYHQENDPILCLRPPAAIGLPIQILYEGFRQFLFNINDLNFKISHKALQASERLCGTMGKAFLTETSRTSAIDNGFKPLWPGWQSELRVKPFDGMSSGRVDRAYLTGILCEVKLEGSGSSKSAFMQICLCYRLLVESYQQKPEAFDKVNLERYADAGYPTFLLVIEGPMLTIYGAFFDGVSHTVEALTGGLHMLGDHAGRRQTLLAKALAALHCAQGDIAYMASEPGRPGPNAYVAGTPRLYKTCTTYKTKTEAALKFTSRLPGIQPIFLAHMTIPPTTTASSDTTLFLAKLPRTYGENVHHYLHARGFAPELLAFSKQPEIPTIYVMEYLEWPWSTLTNFIQLKPSIFVHRAQNIYAEMKKIIQCLKNGGFVHGDLRPNNIMINSATVEDKEEDPQIKLVDFDWSGIAGVATYPGQRNATELWPGEAGCAIGANDDNELFEIWWHNRLNSARSLL
ncbi:hypothetical protein EST38_g13699 [Candolleomyces aberdarensis]|uniref:Protein kinase domain-containing protein n=1 Tax=Candolleomyces aberdarensis TaxID=2316362 RepID=A0A4Q2D1Y8_9AGAR|nr:hypothetical protein EST38_g13699 [Candolleomyces aberdarensis]